MNTETFKGNWNEFKGKVKEQWGKLTDDDLTEINGKREQLLGKLQKTYGYQKDRAEKELSSFEKTLKFDKTDEEDVDVDTLSESSSEAEGMDTFSELEDDDMKYMKSTDKNKKKRAA